ncbi:MAG TPA: PIG-L family deacetylase, partial [Candidatus Saccharimonadales bacterium]|nr:PIG-L family deacetylase [Candidatus Saccharimonadales bacterium]
MAASKDKKTKPTPRRRNTKPAKKTKVVAARRTAVAKAKSKPVRPVITKQKVRHVLTTQKNLPPPNHAWLYMFFALVVLALTSFWWGLLGATLHQSNADQVVNATLFESWRTFHAASFPAAHSFLLKWPLFYAVRLLGPSTLTFAFLTILTVFTTVGLFAYILHRIEKRPLVFGTLVLALASTMMLIPPAPYAGGILPVNMAMLATRNLEYVVYIGSLIILIRARRLRSRNFWLAAACLAVLAASDKLFLTFSLGGAAMAMVVYTLRSRWVMVRQTARWLLAGLLAAAASAAIIWLINISGLTHIAGKLDSGPYGLIHTSRALALGCIFGALGLLTNFGANPAFDAAVLRKIPELAAHRLLTVSGVTYLINFTIFARGAYAVIRLLVASLLPRKHKLDNPTKLSLLMFWSSLAAAGAFVVTDHYYVVDTRYLSIIPFTVFIAAATYLRSKPLVREKIWLGAGTLITIGIVAGGFTVIRTNRADVTALSDLSGRNNLIVQSVRNHPVDVLVGDYWRVLPVKAAAAPTSLTVMPLQDCTVARDILSSENWQPDLTRHSFAYILSFDKSLTNYPHCTLDQIIAHYGAPNQSVLIAGSLHEPKEVLLFYDHGSHASASQQLSPNPAQQTSTVLPIPLDQLPNKTCPQSSTIMNVVAHQDDDLLFINPDLLHDIKAGKCIRTIYVTAGDAGGGALYWQGREQGSEAAYSSLIGNTNIWIHRIVKLSDHTFVTVANPRGNTKVSLIFMRLPDGNIRGQGFRTSHYESLERLEAGRISIMQAADKQSTYTSAELTTTLTTLMETYQPTEVRTQAPYNGSMLYPDHSDHMAVGRYARGSFGQYSAQTTATIHYYFGYPIRQMPPNVSGDDLTAKVSAFLEYAKFDGGVCHTDL